MTSTNTTPLSSSFEILRTDRLILRVFDPSRPEDYDAVVNMYNSDYALRTIGNPGIYKRSDVDTRCAKFHPCPASAATTTTTTSSSSSSSNPPFPTHPLHLIYLPSSPTVVIGVITLFHRHPLPYPDLGYFVHEAYTRRGYATEASLATLKYWSSLGIENIWIGTFDTNFVSQRVARNVGYVEGGKIVISMDGGREVKARAFVEAGGELDRDKRLDGLVIDVRVKQGA